MATVAQMMTEIESLKSQIKEGQSKLKTMGKEWKEIARNNKATRLKIQEIYLQIRTERSKEKIASKQAKLAELLRAKEEAAKIGVNVTGRKRVDTNMPAAAAAHRSKDSSLNGNLDEPVDMNNLESELEIF